MTSLGETQENKDDDEQISITNLEKYQYKHCQLVENSINQPVKGQSSKDIGTMLFVIIVIGLPSQTRVEGLGLQAPRLLKLQEVPECMRCERTFGVTCTQYHCRACGHVSYQNVIINAFGCDACNVQKSLHKRVICTC